MSAPDPDYLEEAAALLRDQRAALERKAETEEAMHRDPAVNQVLGEERLRIAEDFLRLAAIQRGVAPDGPAPDARLAAVLRFATYASFTNLSEVANSVRLLWVIDQMVRAATGCPEDATMAGLGTSPAYERFREQVGEWNEGITP